MFILVYVVYPILNFTFFINLPVLMPLCMKYQRAFTGERILKIVVNPNIKRKRVCYKRPINVSVSTFAVDLNSLEHPDDIKKDEF